jgi:CHAT domain-containing protein/tetratricopeptide (TPR) repeat protein
MAMNELGRRMAGIGLALSLAACNTQDIRDVPTAGPPAQAVAASPNRSDVARLEDLAALQRAGRYEEAIKAAQRNLAEREARYGAESIELIVDLNNLAELHRRVAQHTQAESLYQRMISLLEKAGPGYEASLAVAYSNLGVNYRQSGQYDQAERYLRKGLAIRERLYPDGHADLAVSYANLGTLLLKLGRFDDAENALGDALKALEGNPADRSRYLTVLGNLASLYRTDGEYDKAELYYKRILELAGQSNDAARTERIGALNGLGDLYRLLGDFDNAESRLQQALTLSSVAKERVAFQAETLNNLATLYQQTCRYPQAEEAQKTSLKLLVARYGPEHEKTLTARHNLGLLYYRSGDFETAQSTLQQVLSTRRRIARHPLAMASTLNALAGVEWARGETEQARELLLEAERLRRQLLGDGHPDYAISLSNLAVFHADVGELDKSFELFRQANTIDRDLLEHVAGFASEEQKLLYLEQKNRRLYALFSLITEDGLAHKDALEPTLDAWLQRKGILLEVKRRYREALVYRDAPDAVDLIQRLAQKRAQLSELLLAADAAQSAQTNARVRELEAALDVLERQLSAISPSYSEQVNLGRATARTVAARLPEHSVLIEFAKFDRFHFHIREPLDRWDDAEYIAFLLFPDGETKLVKLGASRRVDRDISELQFGIEEDIQLLDIFQAGEAKLNAANAPAHLLYQRVFALLEKQFRPDTKEIFIAPDGQFNVIPFEILINNEQRFLVQDYRFVYLSSGRDLLRKRAASAGSNAGMLIGAPRYDLTPRDKARVVTRLGFTKTHRSLRRLPRSFIESSISFPPLDATQIEVEKIQQIVGQDKVNLYTQENAIEELFYQLDRPRLIHMATHGFFLPDQSMAPAQTCDAHGRSRMSDDPLLRAGLAFAGANHAGRTGAGAQDGILTAEEVLGLDLRKTELVVLSACETGLGRVVDGEGVYGLRRAFIAAGSGGLVMSLWSVADEATADLMVAFYQAMMRDGKPPAEAMHQAQLHMIEATKKTYGYAPPVLWGAFIYQGVL